MVGYQIIQELGILSYETMIRRKYRARDGKTCIDDMTVDFSSESDRLSGRFCGFAVPLE
jgi:hypothetical protein